MCSVMSNSCNRIGLKPHQAHLYKGFFQARILEWDCHFPSQDISNKDRTHVSYVSFMAGGSLPAEPWINVNTEV